MTKHKPGCAMHYEKWLSPACTCDADKPTPPLRITHVAILYKDVLYSLPQPNRHHDVIRLIQEKTGDDHIRGSQGFINPEGGGFMNRTAAAYRAKRWGQIKETKWGKELYSEDLW